MFSLENSVALISGGNGGIGLSVTQQYLEMGAKCFVVDYQPASKHINALKSQYDRSLVYLQTDITEPAAADKIVNAALEQFGKIDVLFNNAAVFDMAPFLESDEAMFDNLFTINVKAMFFLMQKVAQQMINDSNGGSIINMASQAGRRGEALVSHYCASKAAVISYTQSAALALSAHQIRVNAISPGVIDTPMWETVDGLFAKYEGLQKGEKKTQVGKAVPLGRMGDPKDVAAMAVFLACEESAYITGQTYNVDGGNVLS
jgi:NAD(P)-dependent dehydrogenase (short-subunit alcohol dehydrogenase family)